MKYLHLLPKCCPLTSWVGLCALMTLEAITVWTLVPGVVGSTLLGRFWVKGHTTYNAWPSGLRVGHVAAARQRSHQCSLTQTPNNTKTIERMTRHHFL